jgi:hypothetical protein
MPPLFIRVTFALVICNHYVWFSSTQFSNLASSNYRYANAWVYSASQIPLLFCFCRRMSIFVFSLVQDRYRLKPKLVFIIFNDSVRTAKKTQLFTITKINWLTLFKEIIAVYSENHTKPIKMQSY